jgi:hypothetical protein
MANMIFTIIGLLIGIGIADTKGTVLFVLRVLCFLPVLVVGLFTFVIAYLL